ncbi:MAG: HEAT repeat domain-containing protein [Gemmatimonadota bacterium]
MVVLLGELGHADAVGPLVEILETPEDFFLREAAAEALARLGAPNVPLLERLAREGEASARLFAFGALGEIRAEGTYPFLLEALESEALWLEDEDDLDDPWEPGELEQGVEEVGAGGALLLAHAGKLADRFGDPKGLLSSTRPGRSGFKPGRNDPCACGSGQKYTKCCGKAEPANLRLVERRPVAETGPGGAAGPGGYWSGRPRRS